MASERTVVFICIENACRSLMAEAMFNANPPLGWHAISAGTAPSPSPNPRTVPMLAEIGLGLPDHPPRLLTKEVMDRADLRVTMGCLDEASCPAHLRELELRDWGLRDPSKLDDAGFREVRDEILRRVGRLRLEISLNDRRRGRTQAPSA
ncbi:MAG: low molecular weight phosphatase family protein [Thermoplasmata archaeon]